MVSSCKSQSLVERVLVLIMNNLISTTEKSITIVTAYFDIGRGDWSTEKGHPSHLLRDNQTYLSYFKNLAKLDNEMVVFTFEEMKPYINKLRGNKPTKIIVIDLETKFRSLLEDIKFLINSNDFKSKIPDKQKLNPEYWSEKYVLVTNLKTYFVNKAIENFNLSNDLVAWVDFGYCRDHTTLSGINNWYYPFDDLHVHFFTLKKDKFLSVFNNPRFPHTEDKVLSAILNNRVFIIGGVTVANQNIWREFFNVVKNCQEELFYRNIVDDDQGIYLMCHLKQPNLFKFHYLGKSANGEKNWFGTMQKFHT